jgi:TonB family protein
VRIPAPRLTNQSPTEVYPVGDAAQHSPGFAQPGYAPDKTTAPPAARKSNALPWILGAIILGLSAIVIGLLLMRSNAPADSQVARNTTPSENTTTPSENAMPSESSAPVAESNTSTTLPHHRAEAPTPSPATVVTDEPPPPPPPKPTAASAPRAPISGGVLNGKAVSLPKPVYPPIAKATHASGTVTVQVTIDESGKVISAHAIGGHPLLQQAAVQAANQARFSPTLLSGQPVRVTGVITYNFAAQ